MIAIDLSKQKALEAEYFTGNLEKNTKVFFIIEEVNKIFFWFFTRTCGSIVNLFYFNIKSV